MKLSVLDLCPVTVEGEPRAAFAAAMANAAANAKAADELGYERYWVAEHHGMEGVASAAVSVVLAHIGQHTSRIRLGAGGIMLPNHNPLVIAEQFGTLDALYPGRIDLGLGRAPGADGRIVNALRKDVNRAAEHFPSDVVELRALFAADPRLALQATPGQGADVEMWILGSSLFGAQLAAMLGMPYAFASHFAPDQLDAALRLYREKFEPSATLAQPHCMAAINVFAAETDAQAQFEASSMDQAFVALRTGQPGRLRPPLEGYRDTLTPDKRSGLEHIRQVSAIGSVETVRRELAAFQARTGADELIVSGSSFDPAVRRRSLALTMEAAKGL